MNLANRITAARVLLTGLFLVCFYAERPWLSLAAFLLAALSDFADGYVARRFGLVSNLGRFLDPLADKLLILAALIALAPREGKAFSLAVILIAARELIVTLFRAIAAERGVVIGADWFGKIKTVLQIVTVSCYLAVPCFGAAFFHPAAVMLLWVTAAVTAASGAHYIYANRRVLGGK